MADLEAVLADVSDADRDPPQIDELRQELFLQIYSTSPVTGHIYCFIFDQQCHLAMYECCSEQKTDKSDKTTEGNNSYDGADPHLTKINFKWFTTIFSNTFLRNYLPILEKY